MLKIRYELEGGRLTGWEDKEAEIDEIKVKIADYDIRIKNLEGKVK